MDFVFITGSGRCGTTLVRSLLDGHSQLNVYPREVSSYLENFFINFGYGYSLPIDHVSHSIVSQCLFKAQTEKGVIEVDYEKIRTFLESSGLKEISPKRLLSYVFQMAFEDTTCLNVVDVTSPNLNGYLDFFENCKIIHLLRHPFDTLNSFYRERYKDPNSFGGSHPGEWTFVKGFERVRKSFQQAFIHRENKRVHILRLEDLQNTPEKAIENIFDFLKLKPEKINFEQTRFGRPFKNNSTYVKSNKIFRQENDWSCLTPNDRYFLSKLPWADQWYKIPSQPEISNSFWPFLKRQLGLTGNDRPRVKSLHWLVFRLLPSVGGFYLQDLVAKSRFEMDQNINSINRS